MTEVSLTTAGISEVFVELLLAVVHGNAALGKNVVEVKPAHAREFRRLAQAQRILRVKRHGQFQLQARFRLGGRDVPRLVDIVRNVERDAHGYFLPPFHRLVKPPAAPAMSMKVFGFTSLFLTQRRKGAEEVVFFTDATAEKINFHLAA